MYKSPKSSYKTASKVVSNLAADIVDMFDEFLEEKGIRIPCADPEEELARYDDNCACLYGMEYWGLVDKVEDVIGMYEVKE